MTVRESLAGLKLLCATLKLPREEAALGHVLGPMLPPQVAHLLDAPVKVCDCCGQPLLRARAARLFCGDGCRKAAERKRKEAGRG